MDRKRNQRIMGNEVAPLDWAELGRRVREAAALAAEMQITPATNVRGQNSMMRHPRIMGVSES